jgi:CheY-specific phosphatase CheX/methyl-accepting chemotaxis protein/signal transduction histidine kinase
MSFLSNLTLTKKMLLLVFFAAIFIGISITVTIYFSNQIKSKFYALQDQELQLMFIVEDLKSDISMLKDDFNRLAVETALSEEMKILEMKNSVYFHQIKYNLVELNKIVESKKKEELTKIVNNLFIRFNAFYKNGIKVPKFIEEDKDDPEEVLHIMADFTSIAAKMDEEFDKLLLRSRQNIVSEFEDFKQVLGYTKNTRIGIFLVNLFILLLVIGLIIKDFSTRLNRLNRGVRKLAANELNFKVDDSAKDELGVLASNVNVMSSNIEMIMDEIELMNQELDEKIEARTRSINALLDNAAEGFLSFDQDLIINDEYSAECRNIFGEDIAGMNFVDLMVKNDPAKSELYHKTIKDILTEDNDFKREILMELLQNEFEINDKDIHIQYKLIEDGTKMMVILNDITEQRKLEKKMQIEKETLRMTVKAVTNYSDLMDVIKDYDNFNKNEVEEVLGQNDKLENIIDSVFRPIHTFKGLFSQLDLVNVTRILHDLETNITKIRNNASDYTIDDLQELFEKVNLRYAINKDIKILEHTLGKDFFRNSDKITLDKSRIEDLISAAKDMITSDQKELLDKIEELTYKNLKELLNGYKDLIERLSEQLEKPIKPFGVKGDDIFVDPNRFAPFTKSLVHVFRNSIDHGIEDIDTRYEEEKEEEATIGCEIFLKNGYIHISISDDGGGISIDRVKAKALELKMFTEEQMKLLPKKEIINLIFSDSFSTADTVTDLSGRGVGLAAVKYELEKLGGRMEINTTEGEGSVFSFIIPQKPIAIENDENGEMGLKDVIKPILDRCLSFLSDDMEVRLDPNIIPQNTDKLNLRDISAMMKLQGDMEGVFIMTFSDSLANYLVEKFAYGEIAEDENREELLLDTMSEILNTVLGNALEQFPDDIHIKLDPPVIIKDKKTITRKNGEGIWYGNVNTSLGDLSIAYTK